MPPILSLEEQLHRRTVEGSLVQTLPDGKVQCHACAHRCRIPEGKKGICKVRFNEGGRLKVPRNYVGALQVDPIEKKPFFHALPGSRALSFGMLGCDYHCDYCQNWITSQALRDPASEANGAVPRDMTARDLVEAALDHGCPVITSTYNEPLITSEWAAEVFQLARTRGLVTSYVSNGNATKEVLEYLRPWLDLYKVDLKSFRDPTYRRYIGGTLKPVLETIERLKAMGFWLEVVTLVVPGLNDSEKELTDIARFLASVSRDIPWHVTAFHPDYRMEGKDWTEPARLNLSWEIGKAAGLHYVYSGNRPGEVGTTENTDCPSCGALLIERRGFQVIRNLMGPQGTCPKCATAIPGVWEVPSREPNTVLSISATPKAEEALAAN
ncbi:MAG TPA: AmmeMemoRadiSam system radical SAM enzyme [bacterium]|nr:AmmeMemoRadiSam system radical SAM enzyme [bacterium]